MHDQDTYRVKLEIFEGPLDLLLYLIRKNEVDIYDIPIAMIVEQYMEYLELMRSLNLDVAGDFLVMAATLSQIKSRLLLPRDDLEEEGEEEDPRDELVRRLLDYQRYKEAAEDLIARPILGREVFTRSPSRELMEEAANEAGIEKTTFAEVGVFELLEAFKDVLDRADLDSWHEVRRNRISIMDRINDVLAIFKDEESITFDQLFTDATSRPMIVATFLALLELVRLRVIKAHQEKPFAAIYLVRAVTIDDKWLTENMPKIEEQRS
ncbi:MAG: segregation/condensation protein A [bacterium]